ncbi:hypothetical protein [Pseudonocardia spinosispora]|uniref:hypothetical protein n=1 Tax=Pseudonocardia spinosispora TaxID=103441 RepID=UPI001B7F7DEB|nr:hypothetical protein [Pseudonocardia spinosispora]
MSLFVAMLMVYAGTVSPDAEVTRTGGVPLVPANFHWPTCATCRRPMQFLAQLIRDDYPALSIFMCGNDPGMCDEWEPDGGGNRALLFTGDALRPAHVPADGVPLLDEVSGVRWEMADEQDYDAARAQWEAAGGAVNDILGQVGGEPSWIQGDETPTCPGCERSMEFLVQWETGHDPQTAINFGDAGCGYAFACRACGEARFLTQCS